MTEKRGARGALDYHSLTLPSDRITLGQMASAEPDLFCRAAVVSPDVLDCDAFATRSFELILAEKAVAAATGRPDPYPQHERRYIIEELLHEAYLHYGLSSGIHETRRLAHGIETLATKRAGGPKIG
ncbi:MAG: hypothetical protein SF069_11115 [Phycisphaerae bacterium]|nr:hypothetical protein [Phycisphaerae bacterium]